MQMSGIKSNFDLVAGTALGTGVNAGNDVSVFAGGAQIQIGFGTHQFGNFNIHINGSSGVGSNSFSGIVAVEAPERSGTLITTGIAADLGRTVMAVPARVDSRMSAGCLKLIRDGAILVRNADDVLEAMSELIPRRGGAEASAVRTEKTDPETPPYSVEEAMVMLHVDAEGVTIDELVRLTKLPVDRVNSLVMSLRIKGFVRFLPGNRVGLLTRRQ